MAFWYLYTTNFVPVYAQPLPPPFPVLSVCPFLPQVYPSVFMSHELHYLLSLLPIPLGLLPFLSQFPSYIAILLLGCVWMCLWCMYAHMCVGAHVCMYMWKSNVYVDINVIIYTFHLIIEAGPLG